MKRKRYTEPQIVFALQQAELAPIPFTQAASYGSRIVSVRVAGHVRRAWGGCRFRFPSALGVDSAAAVGIWQE